MKIKLERVTKDKKDTLYQLLQYSLFEESLTDGNEMNDKAIFEYKYFNNYFTDKTRDAFFITEETTNKLLGFVMINTYMQHTKKGHSIAEFMIIPKYRRKNIGKRVAFMCFDMYKGCWEVSPAYGNEIAYKFWKKVVDEYTNNQNEYKDRIFSFKNEKRLSIYIPELTDYWYEQKLLSDKLTMSYNAGYDVSYKGYHYDTGCIDFEEEKWQEKYNKRKEENTFFAYLKDDIKNEFVGYINYQYNKQEKRYECGIVIEATKRGQNYAKEGLKLLCNYAKEQGIKSLYDSFELDRKNTLTVFEKIGFKIIEKTTWKKFNKEVIGVTVKIDL